MSTRLGHRAPPLPPDERRLAILTAAIELLRREETMPSTRRLAAACDIAEGTLFRAFPTKDDLVEALVSHVACPHPFRESLLALPVEETPSREGLRVTLGKAAQVLRQRFTFILTTLGPMGMHGPPHHGPHPGCPGPSVPLDSSAFRDTVGVILAPYRGHLRVAPDVLIDALRYLTFAGCHHGLSHGRAMTPEMIVDLLLDGALAEEPRPTSAPQERAARRTAVTLMPAVASNAPDKEARC